MTSTAFDVIQYRAANQIVIDLIKATHRWETDEGFIADGVICPENYAKQSFRVACILAESYGYDECHVTSIELQVEQDVLGLTNSKVKAPRKLATLLWLLRSSFRQGRMIEWVDFPSLFKITHENTELLQSALSEVAWINVKKASRHSRTHMDSEEVWQHAKRNKKVIRAQLDAISPHLLIPCGKAVFQALKKLAIFPEEVSYKRKWQVQSIAGGPMIVEVTHPRNWWSYEKLYRNFECVYKQLAEQVGAPIRLPAASMESKVDQSY